MEEIKIDNINVKFHYVTTYKKWQYKICKWIKVKPIENFYVELKITISNGDVKIGDIIRFSSSCYQARIVNKVSGIKNNKDVDVITCFLFEGMPVNNFQFNNFQFNESGFYVIGRPFSEELIEEYKQLKSK